MKKENVVLILIVLIVFIGGLVFVWKINNNQEEKIELQQEIIKTEQLTPELDEKIDDKNYEVKKYQPLLLDTKAAISVLVTPDSKYESYQVLFEKNTDEKLPIASLTKLMTAYVVLEYYNLFHKVEISEQAILQAGDAGRLKTGQKLPVKDLLFPLLIESSNDAAYALAETIGKEQFIFLMNLSAKELGLKNTYFVNPTGLDEKKISNYSTINDLVKFTEHLLFFNKNNKDELLWDILSTKEINLYGQTLVNTNQLLDRIPGIIGGRTGETPKARQNLILVIRDPQNRGYIVNIILGSENRFKEVVEMVNWVKLNKGWGIEHKWELGDAFLDWEKIISDAPWGERDAHASIVFQDKLWVFGGLSGKEDFDGVYGKLPHKSDIWISEDGKDWQLITNNAPWGERRSLQIVEFEDKLWLIGGWEKGIGSRNDVWSSINGIDWVKEVSSAPWTAREGHTIIVFNNKIWVFGGVDFAQRKLMNDVWYSEDGINWNQATLNAQWTPRYDHTVTTFKDKMWLFGGLAFGGVLKDDIWVSDDGKNWQLITNNAPWGKRHGHTSVVFKDRIWIISGFSIDGGLNDVWYSKDGFAWRPTLVENQWVGREDHTSVVFKDKIWIMGGMSDNWIWKSNIWHSINL